MDEGVKYLKASYGQFSLSFYWQLKFPLKQILNAVLDKTRKTHSINFWNLLRWIFGEIPLYLGIIVELYISLNMVTSLARTLV